MEILMMNNQLGICNWERNGVLFQKNCLNPSSLHGFLISRRPIFGIVLETKRVDKNGVFSLRKSKCGTINALSNGEYEDSSRSMTSSNKLLEKEFKFQPTFDEYLKAMESVKTDREKTPIRDVESKKQRKVSTYKRVSIEPELEGDGEKLKLSLVENLGSVRNVESVERNELSERSSIHVVQEGTSRGNLGNRERGTRDFKDRSKQGIKIGISEKGGVRTWVPGQRKVNSRESNMNLKVERGMRGDGDSRSSERRDGRWMDRDSSVEQKMSLKVERGMKQDKDSRTSERRDGRWMDRDSSVEQKMSLKVERGMKQDKDSRTSERRDGRWMDRDSSVEQKMSLKVERGMRKDGDSRTSERRDGRWMGRDSSVEQKMSLKVERGMRKDGDSRTSERRDGRWMGRDSSVEQKMSLKVERGMRKDGDSQTSERRDGRWMGRDSSVEQKMSLKVERGMRKDGDSRTSERRDGRWMDRESSVEQKMENSDLSRIRKNYWANERDREFDGDKSFTSNEDEWGGELGQNGYKTQLQKKQMIQNRSPVKGRVSIRDGSMDFSHISKGGSEKISLYRAKREGTLTDNQRFNDKKELYGREIKTEWKSDETMDSKGMSEKEYYRVSNFETNMEDTDIALERGNSYENRNPVRLMNASKIKNYSPRHTMADSRVDSGHVQFDTRRRTSQNSGKFRRENMVSMDYVDKSGHEVERAAFASYEEFTDIRGMPRVSRAEMEERIKNLAKWLNGMDINLPEWMFSKTMRSARIKFTDSSIVRVIQILGSYGNWRRVLQVIEWLQSRERFESYKSRYIYTTALNVLGKAKRPVEALNVFHSMRRELSSYPDLAAYHCIAVTLGQAGYMKELLDVIDCMRSLPQKKINIGLLEKWDPRLEPDIVVYNAVLNACVRRKQWEGAFWVLQQLTEQSLQPTNTTYGLVMEVMFVCGKYNLVHEFFRKVEKSSTPNSLNYKVIVNTLWKEGKIDEAVVAVQDMERRGIVASASLYYDFARCLCSAGRCQDALMQMDKICKVASKPLVVTYTGLMQACLESGNVPDGAYIFEHMQKFCSPNIVTCNIMLKGYLDHGMFEEANDMFKRMLDNGIQISSKDDCKGSVLPDNYTFNTVLDACVSEKRWDDFKYAYQHMLHHGYHFNAKRHLRMVLEACRAGKGELAEITWKHLVHADRIPPAPIAKERFCVRLEENDYAGAISCIAGPQKSEVHSFSEKIWLDLFKTNENRFQKDTLVRLIHEVSNIIAGNDNPRPIFQNLLTSCREFIRTQMTVADDNHSIPDERTLLFELDANS